MSLYYYILAKLFKERKVFPENKDEWPEKWKVVERKSYGTKQYTKTSLGSTNVESSLKDVLTQRHSTRALQGGNLSLDTIIDILRASIGVGDKFFYPSGGRLYPVEVYYVSYNSEEELGQLLHYNSIEGGLEIVHSFDKNIFQKIQLKIKTTRCSGFFVLTLKTPTVLDKYGLLGIKNGLIEAGAVMQNLCLVLTEYHINHLPYSEFEDHLIEDLLRIDGFSEVYTLSLLVSER